MKIKYRACDLCKRELHKEGDMKFKYKAKTRWISWYESGWEKADICSECLRRIIYAINMRTEKAESEE